MIHRAPNRVHLIEAPLELTVSLFILTYLKFIYVHTSMFHCEHFIIYPLPINSPNPSLELLIKSICPLN
jgi:hypothetical protein